MKRLSFAVLSLALCASLNAFAGGKTYQVTGPVLEVTDSTVVVQKGNDKWELQKDAATKVTGDLKTGNKVTIEYIMTAKTVEVKEAPKAKADKAAAPKADAKPAAKPADKAAKPK
ncbi:MAG: hypothetical protein U1F57_06790 [bacterium]